MRIIYPIGYPCGLDHVTHHFTGSVLNRLLHRSLLASPGGWGRLRGVKICRVWELKHHHKMSEATVQEYAGGSVVLYEDLTEIERRFEEVEVNLRMLMGVFIIE